MVFGARTFIVLIEVCGFDGHVDDICVLQVEVVIYTLSVAPRCLSELYSE